MESLCLVWVYVPVAQAEQLKAAVFRAGAGRIGNYEHCAWETVGTGQYRPLAGSSPFLGVIDGLQTAPELRVEFVCPHDSLKAVLQALVVAHPYEEPAYGAVPFLTLQDLDEQSAN